MRWRKACTWALGLAVAGGVASGAWAADKAVKVAFIGPLTGGNAAPGLGARNGFDLAIREANAAGQLPFKIEVIVLDDASDPTTGVNAALKAVSDPEVVAAATHWNSPVGLATIHTFHRQGVPQVFWGTIHPDITNKYNYPEVTRVIPLSVLANVNAAEWLVRQLGYKRLAILHDTTDYGTKNRDEFKPAAEERGAEIVAVEGVTVGQRDFTPILTKIKAKNPQAVFYGGVVTEAALIRTQMHRLGMEQVILIGIPGMQSDTFNNVAGAAAEGSLCSGTFDVTTTPAGRKFAEAYAKAGYKEPFEQNGPYAYDAAGIIVAALKKVGPDRKKLVEAVRGIEYHGVLGLTKFDRFGQTVTGGMTKYVSQGGKWVVWEQSEYAQGKRKLPGK